ncbi:hypothetical protein CBR_g39464 [Chara braunii]|uniref:Uncharacterized protein n=1 Tax=Chara braunii TaxID=69332 RepID=A0A388LRN8_CHABU|nr:hypothetical protein CBR_g39464 [Chara braunii]|eukprot:GBG85000.1 hypothetical protein CBR_g39464 [Chara braunii]
METEQMLADVDDNDSGARGNSVEIEKVGGERNEEDVGSEGPHSGCIVTNANVRKTMAGDRYPYYVNWVPGRVQAGIVGGVHCFAFKVVDQWVAVPAPKKETWRNVCLSFIYERVLRLNDGAPTDDASGYSLEMYCVLQAKGELRLNDFLYDNFDCGQQWVLGGQQRKGGMPVSQDDARRDPRWGWMPSAIPFEYGRVKMQVRDMMGNVWSMHYVNDMFSFRHLDREATADEKEAVTCRPRDALIFDPPVGNPVELALAEGTVFGCEKSITYVHVRGKEATFDGICMDVWDHVAMRKDVVAASNIAAHVIQEGQLYHHVGRDMYGYHVNWARTTLKEVMQYAEEGIHDDDGELRLLTERVSSYFDVRVNIRASITANGEESLRARMLLARFIEAHDLRVDNTADSSAYSLRKVVGWMCTEGMSDEGDVDMTKQQKGGIYMPADFKQMLMTQTKKWGMLV